MRVVPLHVVVGGRAHAEGVDIDPAAVASALRAFTPVSTSRPAPAAFLEAYEAAVAAGADSVVSVHISDDMSSTIGGAHLAAEQSPVPVTVIDSRALGMAMGYAVLAGARLAAGGAPAEEVADAVRAHVRGIHRRVLRRHPGVPAPRRADRQGRCAARVGAVDQADPRPARRAHRAARAGAHLLPGHRAARGARRRGRGRRCRGRTGSTSRCTTSTRPSGPSGWPSDCGARLGGEARCWSSSWAPSSGRTSGPGRWPSPSCRAWCRAWWRAERWARSSCEVAVVAVLCFLIGSINPATLLARALGRDLRAAGSGNPGATNAGRVLGRKWGVLVLVLDVAKAWLPTMLVLRTMGTVPALVAGSAVVLGHVFSPVPAGRGRQRGGERARGVAGARAVGGARGGRRVRAREDRAAVRGGGLGRDDARWSRWSGWLRRPDSCSLVPPLVGVWLIAAAAARALAAPAQHPSRGGSAAVGAAESDPVVHRGGRSAWASSTGVGGRLGG